MDGNEKSWPLPKAKHEFYYPNSCGLRYEAIEIKRCIRAGLTECQTVSHSDSLGIARVEDEIRKQIGVRYEADGK